MASHSGSSGPVRSEASRAGRTFREIAETVLIAVVLAFVIRGFVVETFVVFGPSMEPTLYDAERLFVNKISYKLHPPHRHDIIIFAYPRDPQRDFVKRVIGLPGEALEIRDGRVYINGEFLEESYVAFPDHHSTTGPITVPEGHVFVLGDNRRNSEDSRYFGAVPLANIRGKAFLLYWPLRRFGLAR